ncbi:MAG: carboxypeptidase regulatory-like domain-containing protein [Elainellaceae cyanobacterium]
MKQRFIVPLVLLGLGLPSKALAHGVEIEYQQTEAIEINATYDSGEPMAEAQVLVYAPDDPANPWMTGSTDAQGRFWFAPDRSQAGNWEVTIRQAGHGDIVTIPIEGGEAASAASPAETSPSSNQGTMTSLQKVLMGGAAIWGFVGTALFFARGKK